MPEWIEATLEAFPTIQDAGVAHYVEKHRKCSLENLCSKGLSPNPNGTAIELCGKMFSFQTRKTAFLFYTSDRRSLGGISPIRLRLHIHYRDYIHFNLMKSH